MNWKNKNYLNIYIYKSKLPYLFIYICMYDWICQAISKTKKLFHSWKKIASGREVCVSKCEIRISYNILQTRNPASIRSDTKYHYLFNSANWSVYGRRRINTYKKRGYYNIPFNGCVCGCFDSVQFIIYLVLNRPRSPFWDTTVRHECTA